MINQVKQGARLSWTPKRLETESLLQWWLSEIYFRHFNQNCIVGDINTDIFLYNQGRENALSPILSYRFVFGLIKRLLKNSLSN